MINTLNTIPALFDKLIDELIIHETWTLAELGLKLAEETGEVAEHLFVVSGRKNKTLDEELEYEVADVINCAIACLVRKMVLEGHSAEEIKHRLVSGMMAKNEKYLGLLVPNNPKKQKLYHVTTPNDRLITAYKTTLMGVDVYTNIHDENDSWVASTCKIQLVEE